MRWFLVLSALLSLLPSVVAAQTFKLATFNTESDYDTEPAKVGTTMEGTGDIDLWALQEVEGLDAAQTYRNHAGTGSWRYIVSESGRDDRLVLLYRTDLFRHIETVEHHGVRSGPDGGDGSVYGSPSWGLRGALFVRLQHWSTGTEFYVGNVHLKCCGGDGVTIRAHQAEVLRRWIQRSDVPVLLVGDFNIPVYPNAGSGNTASAAFNTFVATPMRWVRPANLVKTQCDPDFNTMLDLVFHTPDALPWSISARVHETQATYCDLDEKGYADHRPVVTTFTLPSP